MTAGTLPDVTLLEIFDFYLEEGYDIELIDGWHGLVHVCRRWRNVVFSSPRRLNLQLLCKPGRPVTEMLNIWPELPVVVYYNRIPGMEETDNVIAALKLKESVSKIDLTVNSRSELEPRAKWEKIAAVMQDPFPMLEDVALQWHHPMTPVISDSFLGGSAPCLRSLFLGGFVFPALQNLLLSATNLVYLCLWDIPNSGYIAPEAMVTNISVLTRLQSLSLWFRSPLARPDRASQLLPPLTRTLLPSLILLDFKGVTEYLEDLLAQIDVTSLESTHVTFFNQLVFDILQFPDLIRRTKMSELLDQVDVILGKSSITAICSPKGASTGSPMLELKISCGTSDWQLSALAQVCNSCLPALPSLECLRIRVSRYLSSHWEDDMENTQWLELLHPFVTIKDLYLSKKVAPHVASALQELSEGRVTEVLPALQSIFIDGLQTSGLVQEVYQKFVTARGRQVSSSPVAIRHWVREQEDEDEEE